MGALPSIVCKGPSPRRFYTLSQRTRPSWRSHAVQTYIIRSVGQLVQLLSRDFRITRAASDQATFSGLSFSLRVWVCGSFFNFLRRAGRSNEGEIRPSASFYGFFLVILLFRKLNFLYIPVKMRTGIFECVLLPHVWSAAMTGLSAAAPKAELPS